MTGREPDSTAPVVLLVDDEPGVLRFMGRVLQDAGFRIETSTSGLHAVSLIAEMPSPPTLVVSDLKMEPIDGGSLARLVLAVWPTTRFLFVSGFGSSREFSRLPGPVLPKPFTPESLIQSVSDICGKPATVIRKA